MLYSIRIERGGRVRWITGLKDLKLASDTAMALWKFYDYSADITLWNGITQITYEESGNATRRIST